MRPPTTSTVPAPPAPPRHLAARLTLWAVASVLVAFAPAVYFIANIGDEASEASSAGAAAVPVALAAPLLLIAAALAERGATRRPRAAGAAAVGRTLALLAYAA